MDYGIRVDIDMKLKRICESNIFCTALSNLYGQEKQFSLSGYVTPIERHITLQTPITDISFSNNSTLSDCTLNL